MITYEKLAARPAAFASLCGFSVAEFEPLYQDFAAAYRKDRAVSLTRKGQPRKRAAGGGRQAAAPRSRRTGAPGS